LERSNNREGDWPVSTASGDGALSTPGKPSLIGGDDTGHESLASGVERRADRRHGADDVRLHGGPGRRPGDPPPSRQDWARPADRAELAAHARRFFTPHLDHIRLVAAIAEAWVKDGVSRARH
jgi:hypothetical protein